MRIPQGYRLQQILGLTHTSQLATPVLVIIGIVLAVLIAAVTVLGSRLAHSPPPALDWFFSHVRDNILVHGFDYLWLDETEPDLVPDGLFFKIGSSTYVCSASLIKRGVVVTAAHCVANFGRRWASTMPQLPPTVPSSAVFHGWSKASTML